MDSSEVNRLVQAVKAGDMGSYGLLVQHYQHQLFKYCFHMLGQLQEAEDVTQEVFVRGLERLEQYREGTLFGAWLFKIAYHECVNRLNRASTYQRLLRIFSRTVSVAEEDHTPAVGLEYNNELRLALLQLNPKDRHIIVQRIVEENRFEDIAGQLEMSEAAVRKRYERARKQLRRQLLAKGDETDEQSFSYR